jgi:glucose-6-phosphate 1-epimerase
MDAPNQLVVREDIRSTKVHAIGFPDVVVWNPWQDKCALLDDMPNDAYQAHVVCRSCGDRRAHRPCQRGELDRRANP